jgi:uncharacterized protein YcbK (DUF882 family)
MISNVEMNKDVKLSEHLTSSSVAALSHSSKLDGLRLSPHFTLGELCKTSVKTKDGNIPNRVHIENLKRLCGWLERLRQRCNQKPHPLTPSPKGEGEAYGSEGYLDDPIIINSGYRSAAVNKAVGGATGSNHLTGCAVDIRCKGIEQAIRYAFILLDISDESGEEFDELLIEKSAKSVWVHFAVRPSENRRRVAFLQV